MMMKIGKRFTSILLAAVLLFQTVSMIKPPVSNAADLNIASLGHVSVSSYYGNDPAYKGENAIDGRTDTEWASATSSPWIRLDWDDSYTITRIVLYDRPDGTNASSGVLTFSNGTQASVSGIPDNGDMKEVVLNAPVITNSLQLEIAGNGWNGVGLTELQVFGTKADNGGTPVQSVEVESDGGDAAITVTGGVLQMKSKALPEDATNKSVTWAVYEIDGTPTAKAVIDPSGQLTAQADGDVRVVAEAKDGSGVTGYKDIHINQTIPIGDKLSGNATVTVSTQYDSSTHSGAQAIDGALNTEWASNETTPWIQLAWDQPMTITKVALYDRADANNAAGKLVFSNGKEIAVSALPGDGSAPRTIILPNPIVASSIKFDVNQGSGGWNVGLKEFEVYGSAGGLGKPVASVSVSGASGATTIDTIRGTLQLKAAVLPEDATDRSVSWAVFEADGVTPTAKATIDDQGKLTASADGVVTVKAVAKDGSGVSGSMRITITGQSFDPSTGTNIARNADVTVSSEYSSSYIGTNATDGAIGTEWASRETHPWIRMEWPRAQTIRKIVLYDRPDVSNADGGVLVFSNGTRLNVSGIPQGGAPKEIDLDEPVVATWFRFDIGSQTNFNSVGLAEMEVYGFNDGIVTPVESLDVFGESGNAIGIKGGSLQMKAETTPNDATEQRVSWSVTEPDGSATAKATIDANGLLTASKKQDGNVLVRAAALDGSEVTGEVLVSLTNQELNASTPADATVTVDFAADTVKGSPYLFGFNKNPVRAQADVMFPKLADIGMTRIRNTVYLDYLFKGVCNSIEDWNNNTNGCRNPDNWDWDQFWWVDYAKANGMKISMIFAYAPSFLTYSGNMFGVPKDWGIYEEIIQQVYLRYQDDIDWVEILNEPDASWFMNLTGSGYASIDFVKDSYYHIAKAIREVDEDVVMGGLSTFEPVTEQILAVMDDPRITPDMLQYGSFHKYSPSAGQTDINVFNSAFASRATRGFNANAPIMVTEYNTSAGNYEERGFTSASWLGLQLTGFIKQGYYAADFYAAFPSYQPIYGETDFSNGSVSNFGMYKWNEATGTGEFLPLGYTFKLLSKSLGLGKGEFQVKETAVEGVDDAFGAVNSDGQRVAFVVNESEETKNIDVILDHVDTGDGEISASAYRVSGWSDGSAEVPVFVSKLGDGVKASISLPSHSIAGIVLHTEPTAVNIPVKLLEAAESGVIAAQPWDYMQLATNAIQGSVIWKSSIPYVGNVDSTGKFYALTEGMTVITAESVADSNIRAEVRIQVGPSNVPLLQVELNRKRIFTTNLDPIQLSATTLRPVEAMNKSLTWTSNHPEIATVDSNGQVSVHREGTVMIRAASSSNPSVYDESMIVILPQGNLLASMGDHVTVSGDRPGDLGSNAVDGNVGSRWHDSEKDEYWLQADFGKATEIGRYLIVNAGPFEDWLGSKINTYAWKFQTSSDGDSWTTVDEVTGNMKDIADRTLPSPVTARYIRILITDPQYPGTTPEAVRIYEILVLPPSPSNSENTGNSGAGVVLPDSSSVSPVNGGVEIKVTPVREADGTYTATLTDSAIRQALDNVGALSQARIKVTVARSDDKQDVKFRFSAEALTLIAERDGILLQLGTGLASLIFDTESLKGMKSAGSGNEIVIRIKPADLSGLPAEQRQQLAEGTAFDFTVRSGDAYITSFEGTLQASIPYEAAGGINRNAIVVYWIEDAGNLRMVGGKYDAGSGSVTFTTNHLSIYAIGYHPVIFEDVNKDAWYKDAVDFVAARNIVVGQGRGRFGPEDRLTRGQALVMLMRAYGIVPDEQSADNFKDAGQTYYTGYLAAAKRLGVAEGTGDLRFAPDQSITRQDLAVMMHRALKLLGKLPAEATDQSSTSFKDGGEIAAYAVEAIHAMTRTGAISGGTGGLLKPRDTATRAQMAQMLYKLLTQ